MQYAYAVRRMRDTVVLGEVCQSTDYPPISATIRSACMHAPQFRPIPGWPAQVDFTARGIKPISEGPSLISLYRGPVQMFVRWGPIQITKIAESRAACGGRGSLAARTVDKYRQKITALPEKAPPAADL